MGTERVQACKNTYKRKDTGEKKKGKVRRVGGGRQGISK